MMAKSDQEAEKFGRQTAGLARYMRDNPAATVAGLLIIGVLLARFAFLGNPRDS